MHALFTRWLGLLCAFLLLCLGLPARADTPISLFQSFRGNVNFVGTEETLRLKDNTKPCSLVSSSTGIYAVLKGIPTGAVIKSAQLYWAGSGTTPDYKVTFDGVSVTAPAARQYVAKVNANNTVYTYFSGAADVTNQVSKKGNGTYTFSGLTVSVGNPWCNVQGVVGGFALAVVYSHPSEPFRMLNVYEGFQDFQNTSLKISLGDFNVPNPLPASVTGRVGHITWEGDVTLSQGGEDLLFNGYEMTDKYNPKGNQFNSSSNVTGDTTSYGIDFDIYSLTSPVIQPGQSTATTTYKSGQDMVILSAEIVAMPYVANADLSLAMTRTGDLTVGSTASYTLSVANGGIDDETGPITVVDTLPAGLKLVSAGGTGWTCTNVASSTQTVVTCTQPGPVKKGAKMTPLVIAVSPTAAGNYTNSATVSGKTGDDKLANNTATNAGSAGSYSTAAMVFTKEICSVDQLIVAGPDDIGCHRFIGPVTAADNNSKIYVTKVKSGPAGLVASALDTDFPATIELLFSCVPNASGLQITYSGTNFNCQATTWTKFNIVFVANNTSAVLVRSDGTRTPLAPFSYADVGRLTVAMRLGTSVLDTVPFVSKPQYLSLDKVYRSDDGYVDTQGGIGDSWAKQDIGFAKAGERFTMQICGRMANGICALSFGKEAAALGGILQPDILDLEFTFDLFAVNLKGTPKLPIAEKDQVVDDSFLLDQPFTRVLTGDGNIFEAKARYFEAGMLGITVGLDDYLGAGGVTGSNGSAKESGRLVSGTRVVGRFYPDHFVTEMISNFQCLPPMNCPGDAGVAVSGATYSMQPFTFSVKAYGLPRPDRSDPTTILSLYQNQIIDPAKPRPLTLAGAKAPNLPDAAPVGRFDTDPGTQLKPPAAANDFPDLGGLAAWRLGDPYSSAGRAVNTWGAPTPVYLRASMDEFRGTVGAAPTTVKVTSQTPAGAAAGTQYEDGLMVLAGRLFVPNVFGSDLLRLPVPLTAQYWNGSAWVASANDNGSVVASAIRPVANGCRKFFAQDLKSGPCKASPLTAVAGGMPVTLVAGRGTLILQAPARGTVGSVDYTLDSSAAPWLPSTQARATFGLYRSPLIYLREVY
jgi:uncharacterized repeat protein (TIGR01451 family)